MEEVNREEIGRMRDRLHDHGNVLQEHAGHFLRMETSMQNIDLKLDAIHGSIKEDLGEIKAKQDKTNGRVTEMERTVAKVVGGLVVLSAGLPFAVFALSKLTE